MLWDLCAALRIKTKVSNSAQSIFPIQITTQLLQVLVLTPWNVLPRALRPECFCLDFESQGSLGSLGKPVLSHPQALSSFLFLRLFLHHPRINVRLLF